MASSAMILANATISTGEIGILSILIPLFIVTVGVIWRGSISLHDNTKALIELKSGFSEWKAEIKTDYAGLAERIADLEHWRIAHEAASTTSGASHGPG